MAFGSDKGFEIREYFIEYEKRGTAVQDSLTQLAQAVLLSQNSFLARVSAICVGLLAGRMKTRVKKKRECS